MFLKEGASARFRYVFHQVRTGRAIPFGWFAILSGLVRLCARLCVWACGSQVREPLSSIVSRANRIGMMYAPIAYSNPYMFRLLGHAPSFPPPLELAAWRRAKAQDDWTPSKRLMMASYHYVMWNEWVYAFADWTYQVEQVDLLVICERAGLDCTSSKLDRASKTSTKTNHHDAKDELTGAGWPELCNATEFMCGRAKRLAGLFGYSYDA